uniref:Uncharacterized protein n=1 Tax=Anguilla anguilla TaxID=7936 RepID=A0A0E9T9B3_ANGAN
MLSVFQNWNKVGSAFRLDTSSLTVR